ncbi:MAG: hypothetical protein J0M15_16885, partial [Deltaproteobacteria bacterium]|nr:hypothetical protein [Deltaproteobacteria bacterium]
MIFPSKSTISLWIPLLIGMPQPTFAQWLCREGWRPVSGRNFLEILQNDFLFLFSKLHTSQVLVVESCLLFQV